MPVPASATSKRSVSSAAAPEARAAPSALPDRLLHARDVLARAVAPASAEPQADRAPQVTARIALAARDGVQPLEAAVVRGSQPRAVIVDVERRRATGGGEAAVRPTLDLHEAV